MLKGCKLATTDVVYTMWSNLKKTGEMVTGQVPYFLLYILFGSQFSHTIFQVGFHDERAVKRVFCNIKNIIKL
jgi:hypothetical protein